MRSVEIAFTVHTDLEEWTTPHGIYLMVCYGWISGTPFYFGLQNDDSGKRAIFSRWHERDLAFARAHAQDGWTQSSGHEGDFIGVRRHFDWRPGDYIARLVPTNEDTEGEWYEFWIIEVDTGAETWVGALWFPDGEDGQARIEPTLNSTVEIYGNSEIRPADIPLVHVAIARPVGDGRRATHGDAGYEGFHKPVPNSEIRYDAGVDLVEIRVGGDTVRMTDPWYRPFAE